jgi:hypothetical protein
VRRFSSADQPEMTQKELEEQSIPLYWVRMPKILSAAAGMHRWVWDLHYPSPESLRHDYPISAVPHDTPRLPLGPRVLPGQYTVRLTVNGHSYTAPLTVKMDPRVNVSPAELEQQFNLEIRLASLLTESSRAVTQARVLREELQKVLSQVRGSLAESVKALDDKVAAILGKPAPFFGSDSTESSLTRLNRQVGALYGEVDRSDAAPTTAQTDAATEIEHDLIAVMKQWGQLQHTDLPAINRQLHDKNLPEIHLHSALPLPEDEADED